LDALLIMTTTKELRTYVQEKIAEYPELRGQIMDLFQLCLDEIEEGGSIIHEIQLCINDIEETINESLEEAKRL
jgi:hypothetical protein